MFTYFRERKERKTQAQNLYRAAVAQARLPVFYEDYAVPDSVDGRFEMIALHCFILMHRLQRTGESKLSQALFDIFFVNMDRSLREMGVGDLGVPKHMRRMMKGFNGRANHYERALENKEELKAALTQNVYGTVDAPDDSVLEVLANYVQGSALMETLEPVFAPLENKQEKRCA